MLILIMEYTSTGNVSATILCKNSFDKFYCSSDINLAAHMHEFTQYTTVHINM